MSENHHEYGEDGEKKSIIEIPERYWWEDEELKRLAQTDYKLYANRLWGITGGDELFEGSEPRELIESKKDLPKAFDEVSLELGCIDERITGGIHAAGSLILMLDLNKAGVTLRDKKIEGISSHEGCGACRVFTTYLWEKMPQEVREWLNFSDFLEDSDKHGQSWAKKLAEKLGVSHRHISASEMHGPADFHPARCLYYTNTPFDYSKAGLPPGFTIDRHLYPDFKYPKKELQTTFNRIIFGGSGHTFGTKFSPQIPFYIFCIAEKGKELKGLQKEAKSVAVKFNGKVVVSGFLRP